MVKIETRCRIPIWQIFGWIKWHMSSESHLPHCRVLPLDEFNVVIPKLLVTSHGAATRRIQRHVISELRITLQGAAPWWIHCHDSRATCHIAGCSHLAKLMSWSCHIAGCNNSVRHIENLFRQILFYFCFFNAVWALTSGGFRIVSDTLVFVVWVFGPLDKDDAAYFTSFHRCVYCAVSVQQYFIIFFDQYVIFFSFQYWDNNYSYC